MENYEIGCSYIPRAPIVEKRENRTKSPQSLSFATELLGNAKVSSEIKKDCSGFFAKEEFVNVKFKNFLYLQKYGLSLEDFKYMHSFCIDNEKLITDQGNFFRRQSDPARKLLRSIVRIPEEPEKGFMLY
jgi:hypothetical protein